MWVDWEYPEAVFTITIVALEWNHLDRNHSESQKSCEMETRSGSTYHECGSVYPDRHAKPGRIAGWSGHRLIVYFKWLISIVLAKRTILIIHDGIKIIMLVFS